MGMKYLLATVFAGVMCTVAPSFAAAVFETQNTATDEAKVFTFGSPVEADEIQTNNIG